MSVLDKFKTAATPTSSDFSDFFEETVFDEVHTLASIFTGTGAVFCSTAASVAFIPVEEFSRRLITCETTASAKSMLNITVATTAAAGSIMISGEKGIGGSGYLSDGDISLYVTPVGSGTYTNNQQITVNEYGQVTTAVNVPALPGIVFSAVTTPAGEYITFNSDNFKAAMGNAREIIVSYAGLLVAATKCASIIQLGTANGYWRALYNSACQEYHYDAEGTTAGGFLINFYYHKGSSERICGNIRIIRSGTTYTAYGIGALQGGGEPFSVYGQFITDTTATTLRIVADVFTSGTTFTAGMGRAGVFIRN